MRRNCSARPSRAGRSSFVVPLLALTALAAGFETVNAQSPAELLEDMRFSMAI
jgi:hypothetical protein